MTLLSDIYNVTLKRDIRGAAKGGFVRPTVGEHFMTHRDFIEITNFVPQYVFKGGYTLDKCIGGTVSEAGNYITSGPSGAFDGSLTTNISNSWYFQEPPYNGSWIQYQFTSPVQIEKMRIYSWGGGSGWEYWTSMVVSGSNDGINYTEITYFTNTSSASGWKEVTFDNSNKYSHYKMFCTFSTGNLGGGAHVSEIEMMEKAYQLADWPEGYCTEDLCVGGTATANSVVNGNWVAANAFDNGTATYSAWQTAGGAVPAWITYDFGNNNAKKIIQFTLTSHNNTNSIYYNGMPKQFTFQGSNNNTDWVNLAEFSTSWTTYSEKQTFALLNDSYYRYYRLYVITTNTTYCVIGEIEMMEGIYE